MCKYTGTLSMLQLSDTHMHTCTHTVAVQGNKQVRVISFHWFKERTMKGWETVSWNEETPLCVLWLRFKHHTLPFNPCRRKFTAALQSCSNKKGTAVLLQVLSNRQDCVLLYSVCDIEIFIRLNATTTITRLIVKEHRLSPTHCRVAAHTLFTCARTLPTDS